MTGLTLHTSNRLEVLADALAERLGAPLSSPLAMETVVVQSKGMERWLSLQLAERRGVWANYRFPFPVAIVRELLAAFLGEAPESERLVPEHLAWSVCGFLPDLLHLPDYAPLAPYLAGEDRSSGLRLWQLACRIADTFDQYLVYRHDLIRDWERGHRRGDLGVHEGWQADLWQRIVSMDGGLSHRGRLVTALQARLGAGLPPAGRLPERLSLFGVSTLPPLHLELLAAVSRFIPVDLYLLNPCAGYWFELRTPGETAGLLRRAGGGGPDELYLENGHPLLASLGRSGRNLFSRLAELEKHDAERFLVPAADSLLATVQREILNSGESDWPPVARHVIAGDDRSLTLHACHGTLREVEVLHDLLLEAFRDLDGLTPREVLVMAPDIEVYAPLIEAVFASAGEDGRSLIPYAIADRGRKGEDPYLAAFDRLLSLGASRYGAAALLDLLEEPVVAARFSLSSEDLALVRRWVEEVAIRWGLDAATRSHAGLPASAAFTWRFGLDRLLLGLALPDDALFAGILPAGNASGSLAPLLGRLADFVAVIERWEALLRSEHPPQAWSALLLGLLDELFAPIAGGDLLALRRLCAAPGEEASQGGFSAPVPFAMIRARLAAGLAERSLHGFLSGPVTFCTLQPMRSVPFRVVALLGMNDGDFPRSSRSAGFDLMTQKPRPCDPSRRDEDRYLFLEALLSARDRLLVTWQGESPRDGKRRPASVVVGELRDAVAAACVAVDGTEALRLVRHPLQPFSPAAFRAGAEVRACNRLWFDAATARRARPPQPETPRFCTAPLAPAETVATLELAELDRFFRNPAKFFLERRLQLRLTTAAEAFDEREPFLLSGLDDFNLGQECVFRLLDNGTTADAYTRAVAGGRLPEGTMGAGGWQRLSREVDAFVAGLQPLLPPVSTALALEVRLDATTLHARLDHLDAAKQLVWRFAKLKGKDRLTAWLRHLLLCAAGAGRTTVLVGRDATSRFAPLPVAAAQAQLAHLLELYRAGLCAPLPFFEQSSLAYAAVLYQEQDAGKALAAAEKAWRATEYSPGEEQERHYRLAFGADPFGEDFCRIAQTIWLPLLQAEDEGEEA